MADEQTALKQRLGKYEIRREVGRGGMGVVYEGYDPVICRRVALKTLISEHLSGPEADTFLGRLHREAQAAGRLSHPNIVAVYDFGEEALGGAESGARIAYIAMEFIEGRGLDTFLKQNERFSLGSIVRIMGQLLDALEYSHKNGVVHRDIKPSNIILLGDGCVKVTDFGIARLESSTLTQAGTVMGSPSYMSPEQFLAQTVDARADLYAAGVVLYELLTGEVPFSGSFTNIMHRVLNDEPTPVSALNVHAPREADALLARALAKRPADRFQSAGEFKQAMTSMLGEPSGPGSIASQPAAVSAIRSPATPSVSQGAVPRASRQRWPFIAACVVLVCLAGAFLTWKMGHHPNTLRQAGTVAGPSRVLEPIAQPTPTPALSPAATAPGTAVITALGLTDPGDPRFASQGPTVDARAWGDARRQLIQKAVALYIEPESINANYALLRDKLFARSGEYIAAILEQQAPQLSRYGLLLSTVRATVRVRDVQRSLNQISRQNGIKFIRNAGNPRIAVAITVQTDRSAPAEAPQRSPVAENILAERIRSFGFVVVDAETAQPTPDFKLRGQVSFKHLSTTLPASGITIEKVALTSWSTRVVAAKTGEEIYLNTTIPQKRSWGSEELAVQELGQLIGAEFSRDFFLQNFDFSAQKVRLRFTGLPGSAFGPLIAEATSAMRILDASAAGSPGHDVMLDLELAGGSDPVLNIVQDALLAPLNRKLGRECFTPADTGAMQLTVQFHPECATPSVLVRLESLPPIALIDAPASRIEEVVSDPARLRRTVL